MKLSDIAELDPKSILPHYIIHQVLSKVIKSAQTIIFKSNGEIEKKIEKGELDATINIGQYSFDTSETDLVNQLESNFKDAFNWSKEISFRDLQESKSILHTFIELDFYLTPRKLHFDEFEEPKKIKLFNAIKNTDKHIVILGAPGAGKTTIGKYLCISLLLKEAMLISHFSLPIVIRLRDYNRYGKTKNRLTLIQILYSALDLKISASEILSGRTFEYEKIKYKILTKVLDELKLLIIIDGFDEVADQDFRKRIIQDLNDLCTSLTESQIIITSRASDFPYRIQNSWTYEICPLSNKQITEFISKWINDEQKALTLQKQIADSPFSDTAMRPLTLAHLCAIFERYNRIPEKPKSVYKKVIAILLEEWDAQRAIERITKYSNFEVDRKIEFLSRLSFELTTRYHKYKFSKEDLEKCYRSICKNYKLPEDEMGMVVNEIESHNGLIIQSGNNSFEFAHKSLQEYLTAEYLKGLDEIPTSVTLLTKIPNELAIATTLSSNQSAFLGKLILTRLKNNLFAPSFILPYLTRLHAEKPDFSISEKLSLSFLQIYSSVAEAQLTKKLNSEDPVYDKSYALTLIEEIQTLLLHFLGTDEVSKSIELLKTFYTFNPNGFTINRLAGKHFGLTLKKPLTGLKEKYFPQYLLTTSGVAKYFEQDLALSTPTKITKM